jgi:hypothetical protein
MRPRNYGSIVNLERNSAASIRSQDAFQLRGLLLTALLVVVGMLVAVGVVAAAEAETPVPSASSPGRPTLQAFRNECSPIHNFPIDRYQSKVYVIRHGEVVQRPRLDTCIRISTYTHTHTHVHKDTHCVIETCEPVGSSLEPRGVPEGTVHALMVAVCL